MQLFVRTPAPYATESLLGYVLRIAEANGYDSPLLVMHYAGLTSSERSSIRFPVAKLECVLGFESGQLAPISNTGRTSNGKTEFALLGHMSGPQPRHSYLRHDQPAFCPDCVAEQGFLDAFWDIDLVVACPVHRAALIAACAVCGDRLRWNRPGVLTCHCGERLYAVTGPVVSDGVVQLMNILRHKVHGTTGHHAENGWGYPMHGMVAMPLWRLFNMLERLAQHNQASRGLPADRSPMAIVQHAAEVLGNWPFGYRAFLRRMGDQTGKLGLNVVGINARFKGFYASMFKTKAYGGEYEFLKEEYTRFGLTEWGDSVVDERSMGSDMPDEKRFVSKAELARHLGVTTLTVDNWTKRGLLTLKEVTTAKHKRYIADTSKVLVPRRTEGKAFSLPAAAKYIGLPVGVLKELRKSGQYQVRHTASRLTAYHETDLEEFKETLLRPVADLKVITHHNDAAMSLARITEALKFGSSSNKALFVARYLEGTLSAIGRAGDGVRDILFEKALAITMAREAKIEAADGGLTAPETADYLGCDAASVHGLLKLKYLDLHWKLGRERILKSSVDAFSTLYVPLVRMAKAQGTSSRRLVRIAKLAGVTLLTVPCKYKYQQAATFFLKRDDEARLLAEAARHPAEKR